MNIFYSILTNASIILSAKAKEKSKTEDIDFRHVTTLRDFLITTDLEDEIFISKIIVDSFETQESHQRYISEIRKLHEKPIDPILIEFLIKLKEDDALSHYLKYESEIYQIFANFYHLKSIFDEFSNVIKKFDLYFSLEKWKKRRSQKNSGTVIEKFVEFLDLSSLPIEIQEKIGALQHLLRSYEQKNVARSQKLERLVKCKNFSEISHILNGFSDMEELD